MSLWYGNFIFSMSLWCRNLSSAFLCGVKIYLQHVSVVWEFYLQHDSVVWDFIFSISLICGIYLQHVPVVWNFSSACHCDVEFYLQLVSVVWEFIFSMLLWCRIYLQHVTVVWEVIFSMSVVWEFIFSMSVVWEFIFSMSVVWDLSSANLCGVGIYFRQVSVVLKIYLEQVSSEYDFFLHVSVFTQHNSDIKDAKDEEPTTRPWCLCRHFKINFIHILTARNQIVPAWIIPSIWKDSMHSHLLNKGFPNKFHCEKQATLLCCSSILAHKHTIR